MMHNLSERRQRKMIQGTMVMINNLIQYYFKIQIDYTLLQQQSKMQDNSIRGKFGSIMGHAFFSNTNRLEALRKAGPIQLVGYEVNSDEMDQLLTKDCSKARSIFLNWNIITSDGLVKIYHQPWPLLVELGLANNRLGNLSLKWISRCQMPLLQTADFSQNQITSAGILHLSKARFPKLQCLRFNECKLQFGSIYYMIRGSFAFCKIQVRNNVLKAEELLNFLTAPEHTYFILGFTTDGVLLYLNFKNDRIDKRFTPKLL